MLFVKQGQCIRIFENSCCLVEADFVLVAIDLSFLRIPLKRILQCVFYFRAFSQTRIQSLNTDSLLKGDLLNLSLDKRAGHPDSLLQ